MKSQPLYKKYHLDRQDERLDQFLILSKKFSIRSVLYPGCFVHITPSFVFRDVVYIDENKQAYKFFQDPGVYKYIQRRKHYQKSPQIAFLHRNYKNLGKLRLFDLLISQYAGFISHYCKKFLKKGGILFVNDSHGDAGMASLDKDYQLIGVFHEENGKCTFSTKQLDSYFVLKNLKLTKKHLKQTQKGMNYEKKAAAYVFRKLN